MVNGWKEAETVYAVLARRKGPFVWMDVQEAAFVKEDFDGVIVRFAQPFKSGGRVYEEGVMHKENVFREKKEAEKKAKSVKVGFREVRKAERIGEAMAILRKELERHEP